MTTCSTRILMAATAAFSCLLGNAFANAAAEQNETRPNIVVILCDDLGYADVGFNGGAEVLTPHIDKLAAGGMVCQSAYVAHPFCGPSRMAFMTGRYPHCIGAPYNLPPSASNIEEYAEEGVDTNEPLISTTLQQAGYFTGAIGKWHMGFTEEYHPNRRGFVEFYGFLGGGHKYFPAQYQGVYERQLARGMKHFNEYITPLKHNGQQVKETEYLTDGLSREACNFVDKAVTIEKPFFLYLAYNAPHSPLEATEEDLARFEHIQDKKRRTYVAMVYAVDRGVGKLVDTLKKHNQFENTLIVFFSDNGGKLGLGADNTPLREGKGSTYEGGFRVPMAISYPNGLKAGQQYPHPITALDLYPTFARLAGASISDEKVLDGKDVWEDLVANRSARDGGMIYSVRHRLGFSDVGIRSDRWKATRVYNQRWRLFDIESDPGEKRDIRASNPAQLEKMVSEARQWSETHTQPLWFDNRKAAKSWQELNMPQYDKTFEMK